MSDRNGCRKNCCRHAGKKADFFDRSTFRQGEAPAPSNRKDATHSRECEERDSFPVRPYHLSCGMPVSDVGPASGKRESTSDPEKTPETGKPFRPDTFVCIIAALRLSSARQEETRFSRPDSHAADRVSSLARGLQTSAAPSSDAAPKTGKTDLQRFPLHRIRPLPNLMQQEDTPQGPPPFLSPRCAAAQRPRKKVRSRRGRGVSPPRRSRAETDLNRQPSD